MGKKWKRLLIQNRKQATVEAPESAPEPKVTEPEPKVEAEWEATSTPKPESRIQGQAMHPVGVMTGLESAIQTSTEK